MGFEHHGRTYRLDWEDPTVREWDCTVVWSDPDDPEAGIVLDRSAFYPGGGGQPPDHGVLLWQGVQTRIVEHPQGRRPLPAAGRGRPDPAGRHRGHRRPRRRAAEHADADALRAARAVRHGVPRLRRAGHRRQHGARHGPDGLQPAGDPGGLQADPRGRGEPRDRGEPGDRGALAAARGGAADPRPDPDPGRWRRRRWSRCGSSTSTGWTCRPTVAPTSRRPSRSAG